MVILDANILIRAVLGKRVRKLLQLHFARVRFFAPDTAFAEEVRPGLVCGNAMKRIGRCWPLHCHSNVQFGRKTPTSSERASRPGRQTGSTCCFERRKPSANQTSSS